MRDPGDPQLRVGYIYSVPSRLVSEERVDGDGNEGNEEEEKGRAIRGMHNVSSSMCN